jgi:putative flippase GtrA
MPRRATRSVERWLALRTLGRHQIGALVATAVDFGVMIFCVERLGYSPVLATAVGATLGALTNFSLGRAWIFRVSNGRIREQAARYVLVSAGSSGWNSMGEHVMHDLAHVQYVVARVIVAVSVSLLWNFPMQRRFVFREGSVR